MYIQDRQYITKQLNINFSQELEKELGNKIARNPLINQRLRELLPITKPSTTTSHTNTGNRELCLDPSVLQPLIICLFHFEPNYFSYNPYLFSLYIPCLLPDKGLETERINTQNYLDSHTPTSPGQPHKKRKYEVCTY